MPSSPPPSHVAARQLLESHGKTVLEIVEIDAEHFPGSIIYLGAGSCPMTAWILKRPGRTEVFCEPGMPAEPAAKIMARIGSAPSPSEPKPDPKLEADSHEQEMDQA